MYSEHSVRRVTRGHGRGGRVGCRLFAHIIVLRISCGVWVTLRASQESQEGHSLARFSLSHDTHAHNDRFFVLSTCTWLPWPLAPFTRLSSMPLEHALRARSHLGGDRNVQIHSSRGQSWLLRAGRLNRWLHGGSSSSAAAGCSHKPVKPRDHEVGG